MYMLFHGTRNLRNKTFKTLLHSGELQSGQPHHYDQTIWIHWKLST